MMQDHEIDALPFDPRKLPDPNLALPDLTEAMIGWRAWKVDRELPRYGVSPKLFSANHEYYWTPRQTARAVCLKGCEGDEMPRESCSCGFYSAKSAKHLLGMGYAHMCTTPTTLTVIGKVAHWGKVIEGRQGWRSEYAYPVQLFLPYEGMELLKPLASGYDCKVALVNLMSKYERTVA